MKYLLDTNACIGWLRQTQPKLIARIKQSNPSDLALCSIVLAELMFGVENSPPKHRANNLHLVQQLRQQFVSYPFDDRAAEHYGNLRSHLAASGMLIGPNDLLIAAIALAQGLTLVTHNIVEFRRVPGLTWEDWQ
jgi:tRNA(fMet)-specific endonuclease VapC